MSEPCLRWGGLGGLVWPQWSSGDSASQGWQVAGLRACVVVHLLTVWPRRPHLVHFIGRMVQSIRHDSQPVRIVLWDLMASKVTGSQVPAISFWFSLDGILYATSVRLQVTASALRSCWRREFTCSCVASCGTLCNRNWQGQGGLGAFGATPEAAADLMRDVACSWDFTETSSAPDGNATVRQTPWSSGWIEAARRQSTTFLPWGGTKRTLTPVPRT